MLSSHNTHTNHKLDWPPSLMSFFSKTDNLSKIAIYKLNLEVEVLGLDIITKFERIEFLEDDFFS